MLLKVLGLAALIAVVNSAGHKHYSISTVIKHEIPKKTEYHQIPHQESSSLQADTGHQTHSTPHSHDLSEVSQGIGNSASGHNGFRFETVSFLNGDNHEQSHHENTHHEKSQESHYEDSHHVFDFGGSLSQESNQENSHNEKSQGESNFGAFDFGDSKHDEFHHGLFSSGISDNEGSHHAELHHESAAHGSSDSHGHAVSSQSIIHHKTEHVIVQVPHKVSSQVSVSPGFSHGNAQSSGTSSQIESHHHGHASSSQTVTKHESSNVQTSSATSSDSSHVQASSSGTSSEGQSYSYPRPAQPFYFVPAAAPQKHIIYNKAPSPISLIDIQSLPKIVSPYPRPAHIEPPPVYEETNSMPAPVFHTSIKYPVVQIEDRKKFQVISIAKSGSQASQGLSHYRESQKTETQTEIASHENSYSSGFKLGESIIGETQKSKHDIIQVQQESHVNVAPEEKSNEASILRSESNHDISQGHSYHGGYEFGVHHKKSQHEGSQNVQSYHKDSHNNVNRVDTHYGSSQEESTADYGNFPHEETHHIESSDHEHHVESGNAHHGETHSSDFGGSLLGEIFSGFSLGESIHEATHHNHALSVQGDAFHKENHEESLHSGSSFGGSNIISYNFGSIEHEKSHKNQQESQHHTTHDESHHDAYHQSESSVGDSNDKSYHGSFEFDVHHKKTQHVESKHENVVHLESHHDDSLASSHGKSHLDDYSFGGSILGSSFSFGGASQEGSHHDESHHEESHQVQSNKGESHHEESHHTESKHEGYTYEKPTHGLSFGEPNSRYHYGSLSSKEYYHGGLQHDESHHKYHHTDSHTGQSQHEQSLYHHENHYAYPKYEYHYKIKDPHTGDYKVHHEVRDGDAVKGAYTIHDSDGSLRVVEYTADNHSGFNAVVKKAEKTHHTESHNHH